MMRRTCVVGLCSALTIGFVIGSHEVSAQTCVSQAPHYSLTSDTVDWSIQVASGQSCVRTLRSGNIVLERVTLTTPPKSGKVQLVGPGFRYTANSGFHGEDSFTIEVLGLAAKVRGTSTIHVVVSVKE
jgi:Bacterial Ig domain